MSHRLTNERCFVLTRQIEIDYQGANNYSQFSYDGLWRNTKIVETVSGSVTSTKQFVWEENKETHSEARDGSSVISAQYFIDGQTIGGTTNKYCYTQDHLGSVHELTDSSGNIQAQYSYDPYGRKAKVQGSSDSDFQFAGYYLHASSGLNLTLYRSYNSGLNRWISRDPIEEAGGNNLYQYVDNAPIDLIDPSGTDGKDPNAPPCITNYKDCFKWCDDTAKSIASEHARATWRAICYARCRRRFPPPPTPVTGGTKKPTSIVSPQPGNALSPPIIIPVPIPAPVLTPIIPVPITIPGSNIVPVLVPIPILVPA